MGEEKSVGRTLWDALVELLPLRVLLIVGIVLLVVLSTALLLTFRYVDSAAEPGTQVEFYGFKYMKAKLLAPVVSPKPPDEVSTYSLPKNQPLPFNQATVLFDGTVAIENVGSSAKIFGANIAEIRLGARGIDGKAASLERSDETGTSAFVPIPAYVEIQYRNRVFAVTLQPDRRGMDAKLSVDTAPRPTLRLALVRELPQVKGE